MTKTAVKPIEPTDLEGQESFKVVASSAPKLSALDKLYVRSYLATLDHIKAHKVVQPSLEQHKSNNIFSRKEAVQFHISLGLQEASEALSLSPEMIIAKLYKEATREGNGSNHAARVTALTVLGKQYGMFQEKKESTVPIINIISYSTSNDSSSLSLPSLPEEVVKVKSVEEPKVFIDTEED